MENSVNDETSLPEEKVSDKRDRQIQKDNRINVNSKESNEERLVLSALEIAEEQKSDEFQDQRSEPGSLEREKLGKHPQLESKATKAQ